MKQERMLEILRVMDKFQSRINHLQRFIKEIDKNDYPNGGKEALLKLAEKEIAENLSQIEKLEEISE